MFEEMAMCDLFAVFPNTQFSKQFFQPLLPPHLLPPPKKKKGSFYFILQETPMAGGPDRGH